jgi:hypothetical protein
MSSLSLGPPLQPLQALVERQAQGTISGLFRHSIPSVRYARVFVSARFGLKCLHSQILLSSHSFCCLPSSGLPLASPNAQEPTTRRNDALSTNPPRCPLAVRWTQPVIQQLRRISGRRLILQSLKWRWRSHRSETVHHW